MGNKNIIYLIPGEISITLDNYRARPGENLIGDISIRTEELIEKPVLYLTFKCLESVNFRLPARRSCSSAYLGKKTRSYHKVLLKNWNEDLFSGEFTHRFQYKIPVGVFPEFRAVLKCFGEARIHYLIGARIQGAKGELLKGKTAVQVMNGKYGIPLDLVPKEIDITTEGLCKAFCKKKKMPVRFFLSKPVYSIEEKVEITLVLDLSEFPIGLSCVTFRFLRVLGVFANLKMKSLKKHEDCKVMKEYVALENLEPLSEFEEHHFSYLVEEFLDELSFTMNTELIKCEYLVEMEIKTRNRCCATGKIPKMEIWFGIKTSDVEDSLFIDQ